MSKESTSYMQVACRPMQLRGLKTCYNCTQKRYCDAYTLISDLTAIRHVCPLVDVMEHCVIDGTYLPHVLPTKILK